MSKFLLWPALACGLTLSACAPTLNSLSNVVDTSPSPDRAGPLVVGQTWAVSGLLLGNQPVSKVLAVPRLIEVRNGSAVVNATVSVYDQATAAQLPRPDYQYVSYTNNDQLKQARFAWSEAGGAGTINLYDCLAPVTGSVPLTGVLTMRRLNNQAVDQQGTCTATPSAPPAPATPTPDNSVPTSP